MSANGATVWITGLPSSGKSTFAEQMAAHLLEHGVRAVVLDGDRVRDALVPRPGYTETERADFYKTLAQLAYYLETQGLVVLVAATAHKRSFREQARELSRAFFEVYLQTPVEVCQARDEKGLYALSKSGQVSSLPGAGSDFEPPESPDLRVLYPPQVDRFDALLGLLKQGRGPDSSFAR